MYQMHKFAMQPAMARGGFRDILGKITGTIGSVLPGPIGAAAKTASRIITPGASTRPSASTIPTPRTVTSSFVGIRAPLVSVGRQTTTRQELYASGALPGAAAGSDGCPKGYHLNKTGYFTKSEGYVEPRTKCVRNRTRNVANGRALRRAIGRASSFDKLVKRNRKSLRSLAKI